MQTYDLVANLNIVTLRVIVIRRSWLLNKTLYSDRYSVKLENVFQASTSSGGGRSADEVVDEIANDMIAKMPPNFNIEFANKKYPVGNHQTNYINFRTSYTVRESFH